MNIKDYKAAWLKLSIKCDLSGSVAIEAVKRNGDALRYVKDQSESLCLEAVKENGYALQYVKEQTESLCLEAVKQNGYALRYVKEQTESLCLEAVKEEGDALQYVNPDILGVTDEDIAPQVEEMTEEQVSAELGRRIKFKS